MRLRIYNNRLITNLGRGGKALGKAYSTGGYRGVLHTGTKSMYRGVRSIHLTRKQWGIAAGAAVLGGTIAYGMSSRPGKPSRHMPVRAYRRTAHAASRTVAIPAHGAYGFGKGLLSTGNPIRAAGMGVSRSMTAAEGWNPMTGRRATLSAKRYRATRYRNQKAAAKMASGGYTTAKRRAAAAKRKRVGGRFA